MRVGSNPTADTIASYECLVQKAEIHIICCLLAPQLSLVMSSLQFPLADSMRYGLRMLSVVLRDGSSRGLAAVNDGFAVAGKFLVGCACLILAYLV